MELVSDAAITKICARGLVSGGFLTRSACSPKLGCRNGGCKRIEAQVQRQCRNPAWLALVHSRLSAREWAGATTGGVAEGWR
jgi:hypothetical protein